MRIHKQGCQHIKDRPELAEGYWMWLYSGWSGYHQSNIVMGSDAMRWDGFPANWEFIVIWPDTI